MLNLKKNFKIIPIVILMGLVPLIVRMKKVSYPYFDFIWSVNMKSGYDIFAYYKSMIIIFTGAILLMRVLYLYLTHRIDFKNKYVILLLMSAFFIVLAYVFSDHQYIASFGFKDRFEGSFTLLSYIVITLYILLEYNSHEDIDNTMKYVLFFIGLMSLIGIGQYFKLDVFHSDWGKLIFSPKDKIDDLVFKSQLGRVYMTLYNPNYVGTYFVLMGPLMANLFINSKKRWKELLFLLIYIALVFSLAGSQSRGGFLGALVALPLLCFLNVFLNKSLTFKNKIVKIPLIIIIFLVVFLAHGNNVSRMNTIFEDTEEKIPLESIYTMEEKLYIKYDNKEYFIKEEENGFVLYEGKLMDYSQKLVKLNNKIKVLPWWLTIKTLNLEEGDHTFIVSIEDTIALPFGHTSEGMRFINKKAYYVPLKKVPALYVFGKESLGSGRVYIWSRSIPLLMDTLLIGNGADTYPLYFPQTDYIGKFKGFGDYKKLSETIVDKPHNLYLQMGINTGVISLLIYLGINFLLIFDLFQLIKNGFHLEKAISFIAIITGYGITMLFNDSAVVVSTIYWVIIGLSMVLVGLDHKKNSINFFSPFID